MGKMNFVTECKIEDMFAVASNSGKTSYHSTYENFYAKGETLFLRAEVSAIHPAKTYDFKLLLIDPKRNRHMIDAWWLGKIAGSDNSKTSQSGIWASQYFALGDQGVILKNSDTLVLTSQVIRYTGADTVLELRPYSNDLMQGVLMQNLDVRVTQSAVQSLFSVLKCKNISDLSGIVNASSRIFK